MNLIRVDWQQREEFWNWCEQNGTTPQHQRSEHPKWDIWYVPDERVHLLAILKWQ